MGYWVECRTVECRSWVRIHWCHFADWTLAIPFVNPTLSGSGVFRIRQLKLVKVNGPFGVYARRSKMDAGGKCVTSRGVVDSTTLEKDKVLTINKLYKPCA